MEKLLLLTLLLPLFAPKLKADLGGCVVYQAKFYLKNGTIFNGSFEMIGYGADVYLDENGSNGFCNDKGVFYLLKKSQREYGRVSVFKNLHYVQPRPMRKHSSEALPNYGLVFKSDLVFVDSNDISKMIFWSATYSKRYWLTSRIVIGTLSMLDTVRNQKYWNHLFFATNNGEKDTIVFQDSVYIDALQSGFVLYNYNAQINIAELKRLIYLKFPIDTDAVTRRFIHKHRISEDQGWTPKQRQLHQDAIEQKIQAVKAWFWKKGILVVAVNGTC